MVQAAFAPVSDCPLFLSSSPPRPQASLSLPHHPLILDSSPLQLSYVLAFDGFPRFLDTGVVQSDRSLIAAFCGQRRDRPLTVQALSGMGTGGMGPLSWTVLCPCTLLPEVGSGPSLTVPATDLLGDTIPCHLWVAVSSAEDCTGWVVSLERRFKWGTQNVAGVGAPKHLSPQPSGSQPGVTLPLGVFSCVWRCSDYHNWRYYWFPMGRGIFHGWGLETLLCSERARVWKCFSSCCKTKWLQGCERAELGVVPAGEGT